METTSRPPKRMWIARDGKLTHGGRPDTAAVTGNYVVSPFKMNKLTDKHEGIRNSYYQACFNVDEDSDTDIPVLEFCAEYFERRFPHLKMEYGEGPREILVSVEFAD